MSIPTIDHMIYTLSEIALHYHYHPPPRPSTSTVISRDNRQRLKTLSLFSLLLVTGGSGDVAAMSLRTAGPNRLELCYSKNRPCTLDETAYITELFAIAANPTSSIPAKFTDLFNLVLCECKDKIIGRLRKLCSRLRDLGEQDNFVFATLNPRTGVARNPLVTQCDSKIRALVGTERFPLDYSLADFLKEWFRWLLLSLPNSPHFELEANKGLVYEIINISYLLVHESQTASILDMTLLHPIRKLGDYRAAIAVLIVEVAKLNEGRERGVSIREQIVNLPPDTQLSGDFLSILNQWARHNGTSEVTEEDLRKAYRGVREIPGAPEAAVKACVHCECALALAFAKSRLSSPVPTTLVVGMSKFPCWLCREFLTIFHNLYPHITIHAPPCSGKLKSGWTVPPKTPSEVVNGMRKRLQDAMSMVLSAGVGTRISDSPPPDLDPLDEILGWSPEYDHT